MGSLWVGGPGTDSTSGGDQWMAMGPSGEELTPGEQSLRVEKFSSLTAALAVVETGAAGATDITNNSEESVEAAMMVQGLNMGGGNMVDFDEVDATYPRGGNLAIGCWQLRACARLVGLLTCSQKRSFLLSLIFGCSTR